MIEHLNLMIQISTQIWLKRNRKPLELTSKKSKKFFGSSREFNHHRNFKKSQKGNKVEDKVKSQSS